MSELVAPVSPFLRAVRTDGPRRAASHTASIEWTEHTDCTHVHIPPRGDWHTLILVEAGPVDMRREFGGQRARALCSRGSMSVVPAGSASYFEWESPVRCVELRLARETVARLLDTLRVDDGHIVLPPALSAELHLRDDVIERLLFDAIDGMPHRPDAASDYWDALATTIAMRLIQRHARKRPAPSRDARLVHWRLRRVVEHVEQYLDRDITLAVLADVAGLSVFHFARAFKASTDVSPHEYIVRRRLERARDAMRTTNATLAQIALDCGFSSHSHFSKAFHARWGVPPAEWRNAARA